LRTHEGDACTITNNNISIITTSNTTTVDYTRCSIPTTNTIIFTTITPATIITTVRSIGSIVYSIRSIGK
jgi:hypothetical protein